MKLLIASLLLTLVGAQSASAMDVSIYEDQLKLVPRMNAGTLEKDVDRSQGRTGLNIQLQGATPEQTALLISMHAQKVARNMASLRRHVHCVVNAAKCAEASPR